MTVDLAQVLDRLLHAVTGQTNVIDRDELALIVDQLAVLLLIHRLDRIPVGIEDLGRVFVLVEHRVDPRLIELVGNDQLKNGIVQALIETMRLAGEAAFDKGHDQGQEVVRQARALDDQGGQRQVGRGADHQRIALQGGVGEQVVEVGLEPVEVHVGQLVVLGQRDDGDHRRAVLEEVQVAKLGGVVLGLLVLLQRFAVALGLDRQQADALDGLGHLVEVRQVDGAEEQVVDIQPCRLFVQHPELVQRRRGTLLRHHRLGISHRHRPGQAHKQIVGIQADGFANVDAGAAEVILVVVGGHRLGGEDVEDLLGDVLVGVTLHGVDVDVLDIAVVALFGVTHDVVGDQHHGVPRADAAHHAFFAVLLIVEVVGEVPLLGQVLAQQAAGVDM